MSFTNFMRRRGSRSAIQATIAEASSRELFEVDEEFGFGSDYQSVGDFDVVKVINDPEVDSRNAVSFTSKGVSINTETNCDVRSEELAILSTSCSSSSGSLLVGASHQQNMVYSVAASNSQRIDDWCLNNELDGFGETLALTSGSRTCSRVQDVVDSWGSSRRDVPPDSASSKECDEVRRAVNYTSSLLKGLNEDELLTVKQLTRELLPLLRNSRRAHSAFTNRFRDIPSVFPQRDLILACSLRYSDLENEILTQAKLSESFSTVCLDDARSSASLSSRALLAWSLVPRITENDLR